MYEGLYVKEYVFRGRAARGESLTLGSSILDLPKSECGMLMGTEQAVIDAVLAEPGESLSSSELSSLFWLEYEGAAIAAGVLARLQRARLCPPAFPSMHHEGDSQETEPSSRS
jgi:hypothetical protein